MKTFYWMLVCAALVIPSLARCQDWDEIGPNGGWPTDMTLDPTEKIVVTASLGGVYRSRGPASDPIEWERIYEGPAEGPAIAPRSVATNGAGDIFVGTDGYQGTGFIRSINGSWEIVNNSLSNRLVSDLLVTPDQKIWACTYGEGLWSSNNNGTTFTSVPGLPSYLAFIRQDANGKLHVGVEFDQANLFSSGDGGTTWIQSDIGIDADPTDLCADPMDPTGNTLYLAAGDKVFVTTNGGGTWASLGAPASYSYTSVAATPTGDVFAANYSGPVQGGTVYHYDGAGWTEDSGLPENAVGGFLNTPEWLYLEVTGPGPYRRGFGSGGWEQITGGMHNVFINFVVPDDLNGMIYVGTQGLSILESSDLGDSWQSAGDGIARWEYIYDMVVGSGGTKYASTQGAIYRMIDGSNWSPVYNVPATALAVNEQGHVYGGYGSRIYNTTNQGNGWTQIAILPGVQYVSDIACTGSDVYVTTGTPGGAGSQGVFLSTNNGANFSQINTGLADLNVRGVAIDPDPLADCLVTAATSSGLYDFDRETLTWALNASYGPGNVKRVRKSLEMRVALEDEALKSLDHAMACLWEGFSPLPPSRYYADFGTVRLRGPLASGASDFVQILGTFGYGLWRSGASPAGVDFGLPTSESGFRSIGQNPFERLVTMEFELMHPSAVQVRVFDAAGRAVTTLVEGREKAGRHSVGWDAAGQASGVYFFRLLIDGAAQTQRLVLLR